MPAVNFKSGPGGRFNIDSLVNYSYIHGDVIQNIFLGLTGNRGLHR